MDLDLTRLHAEIAALEPVAHAHVRIAGGGVLQISVTERKAAALWRHDGGLEMLDAVGHRLGAVAARADRPALPLVAGPGADRAVAEALELIALAEPLGDRLRGLTRVGGRRWTLTLTDEIDILLPETGAASALARVLALDAADEVLSRAIVHIDMRDPRRPVLRLRPGAMDTLRRVRSPIEERDA